MRPCRRMEDELIVGIGPTVKMDKITCVVDVNHASVEPLGVTIAHIHVMTWITTGKRETKHHDKKNNCSCQPGIVTEGHIEPTNSDRLEEASDSAGTQHSAATGAGHASTPRRGIRRPRGKWSTRL